MSCTALGSGVSWHVIQLAARRRGHVLARYYWSVTCAVTHASDVGAGHSLLAAAEHDLVPGRDRGAALALGGRDSGWRASSSVPSAAAAGRSSGCVLGLVGRLVLGLVGRLRPGARRSARPAARPPVPAGPPCPPCPPVRSVPSAASPVALNDSSTGAAPSAAIQSASAVSAVGSGVAVADQLDRVVAQRQLVLGGHRGEPACRAAAAAGRRGAGLAQLAGQDAGVVVLGDDVAARAGRG